MAGFQLTSQPAVPVVKIPWWNMPYPVQIVDSLQSTQLGQELNCFEVVVMFASSQAFNLSLVNYSWAPLQYP